jgi:hypothetical protein
MRVLVCGDRNWTNAHLIRERLARVVMALPEGEELFVIHGAARGADSIAGDIAQSWRVTLPHGRITVLAFPANWGTYGKAAGVIRNQQMLVEGRPNLVLAFHNDIESSKGTKDMVRRARKAGILTEVIGE